MTAFGVLFVIGAALAVWAFWIEPSRLVVKRVTLDWKPAAGRGLRIALISDLHVGSPFVGLDKVREVVAAINQEECDLVVIAGDFVASGRIGAAPRVMPEVFAPELQKLRSRLGVLAVLGNQDWWYSHPGVRRPLQSHGITVLHNRAVSYPTGSGKLWIAGLGELWAKEDDMKATLEDVPHGAPVILLTHNPDIFPTAPPRVNLVLAGHTHGGQVKFPFIGAPVVPSQYGQRYAAGYIEENGRRMFVTTGVGTSILPVRFGVPPEIVILTLGSQP